MFPSNTASRSKSRFQTKSAHRFPSKTANKFRSRKQFRCPKKVVTKYQKKSAKMYPSKERLSLFLARFQRKFVDMEVDMEVVVVVADMDMEVVEAAVEVMEVDHPVVDTMAKKERKMICSEWKIFDDHPKCSSRITD